MNNITQLARLGLFDARVPRYTSYPTAPHFSEAVGATQFGNWVSDIPQNSRVSLYVHVPFCRRLCWFCACRTQGTQSTKPLTGYVAALKAELALLAERLPQGVTLSRLHWGGGTPTLLPADVIAELAKAIFDVVPLAEASEFSVEIDPNEIDAARIKALTQAGMTRASIGVQDFDDEIQQLIGRIQSFEVTQQAAEMLRENGVRSLNADILFGLPKQTTRRMTESVQKLLSLNPDRVALYGYAHVPWMARRQNMIPSEELPTPEERLALFETARRLFLWDGYQEIGIDHFARPDDRLSQAQNTGRLRRNFQGYTDDTADVLIGLGASAISRFPQGYVQNTSATGKYVGLVRDGVFPAARGHVFSGQDRLRGRLIEYLMCDFRINKSAVLKEFDVVPDALDHLLGMAAMAFPDMVELTEDGLYLPHASRPLTRMIARVFDTYAMNAAGHSSAI